VISHSYGGSDIALLKHLSRLKSVYRTSSNRSYPLTGPVSDGMTQLSVSSAGSLVVGMSQDETPMPSINTGQPGDGYILHTWLDDREDELMVLIDQGGTAFVGRSYGTNEKFSLSRSLQMLECKESY
jgi:hypothetical protein